MFSIIHTNRHGPSDKLKTKFKFCDQLGTKCSDQRIISLEVQGPPIFLTI